MCEECGCGDEETEKPKPSEKVVEVNRSVKEVNDVLADQIRSFLQQKKVLCVNIMGSPGSGKTSVIEGISKNIKAAELMVIQGDLESEIDKKRLQNQEIDSYQINTHTGCHLNAAMVNKALLELNLDNKKYLIIENVGNLVCPAGVQIGQHVNIVVGSTTEGPDKPKKYPHIFADANIVLVSKYDLAEATSFDEKSFSQDVTKLNPKAKIFNTSSKNSESFEKIAHFLIHKRDHLIGKKHEH